MNRPANIMMLMVGILLVSSTCRKEVPPAPLPGMSTKQDTGVLPLRWRTALDNGNDVGSINPILNSRGDILLSARYNAAGNGEVMKLYDGRTGALKWQWSDYLRHEEYFNDNGHAIVRDVLVLSAHSATYALDMLTGVTIWKNYIDTVYGSADVFSDGEYIYKSFQAEAGRYSSYILRTRYDRLHWELLCTFTDPAKKYDQVSASGITFAKNARQEKLVIFTLVCAGLREPWAKICCYNETAGKFEWIRDYSDRYLAFTPARLISNGTLAYTFCVRGASHYLSAFRVADGSLAWQQPVPDFGVNLFLYGNAVISLCNGSSPVQSFDQQTGSLVWEQRFAVPGKQLRINFDFGDACLVNQYLFSSQCSNLLALDARDGSLVFCDRVVRPGKCLQYGVAVDKDSRTFYAQDGTHVNCYELPQEIRFR